jgi:hypothetical protein
MFKAFSHGSFSLVSSARWHLPELPRYKYVVQAVIGEQRGSGVKLTARCLWDLDTDNYSSDVFLNVSRREIHIVIHTRVYYIDFNSSYLLLISRTPCTALLPCSASTCTSHSSRSRPGVAQRPSRPSESSWEEQAFRCQDVYLVSCFVIWLD